MLPHSSHTLAAGPLCLTFAWRLDRWGHHVTLDDRLLAESVEESDDGSSDPRWPASPVLTEVMPTEAAGRPAIVGVGRAGRSHFSASFTPHPTLAGSVLVEIACRVQEQPGRLGSTYRTADGRLVRAVPLEEADASGLPRTIQWSYAIGPQGIVAAASAACDPPADASHF
ncbi:MAG: hypothetical protein WCC69_07935 [Pirellulales bacterium]